jgi:hypothetical protein
VPGSRAPVRHSAGGRGAQQWSLREKRRTRHNLDNRLRTDVFIATGGGWASQGDGTGREHSLPVSWRAAGGSSRLPGNAAGAALLPRVPSPQGAPAGSASGPAASY